MRLEEVGLQVERLLACPVGEKLLDVLGDAIGRAVRGDLVEAKAFRVIGHVLEAEQNGVVAAVGQEAGDMPLARPELPAEVRVREAQHAVAVRVAPRRHRRAAGAAARRRAEALGKAHALGRQPVHRRRVDAPDAVAAEVAAQVVTGDLQDVRSVHGRSYSLDGQADSGRCLCVGRVCRVCA